MLRTHRSLQAYCATFVFPCNGAPNWQGKTEVQFENYRPKLGDNIDVDLSEIYCESEDWIYLAYETIINHWVR
jgi:hypothetical protein